MGRSGIVVHPHPLKGRKEDLSLDEEKRYE